jgi:hypothetical protein
MQRLSEKPSVKLPPIAAQLTAVERENYFGADARAAFFDYYHHLSRQRVSVNPEVVQAMANATAPSTYRSGTTVDSPRSPRFTSSQMERAYLSGAANNHNNSPVKFAQKGNGRSSDKFVGAADPSKMKKETSLDREDNYTWLKINEQRHAEEEKKMILNHLLTVESMTANKGTSLEVRPESARTKFLRGCVDKGILPHPSLIIRREITTMLNVSSLGMGNEVAKLLAEALDSLPLLVGLSIADNNLNDSGLVPIVNKLAFCKNLRLFDLSNNKVDSLTAGALRTFLCSDRCHLVVLRMQNANVDDYEASQFMDAIAVRHTVKELDLSHNLLGSHEFAMNRTKLTGGEAIGRLLKSPECMIKILKLAWNMIRFESGKELVEAIKYNQVLTYLDLSYNHLGVEGGEILGDALHSNKSLRVLKLAHNNLTARPTLILFAGVKSCQTLRELDLSENPIGEEGAKGLLMLNILNGDRLKTNIKNCSVRITDPSCWFEPFSPKGEYTLNLADFYDRSICFELLNIVARDKDLEFRKFQYQGADQPTPVDLNLQIFVEPIKPNLLTDEKTQKKARYDELPMEEFNLIDEATPADYKTSPTSSLQEQGKKEANNSAHIMRRTSVQFIKNIQNDVNSLREVFRETADRIFEQYDTDHSGWLDREELAYILEQLGLHGSHHLVDKLFSIYDTDHSGKVEEGEFILFLMDVKKSLEKDNFFHICNRYLYDPANPANSSVSFVYDPNPENENYFSDYKGARPVQYIPPSEGKLTIIVDGRVNADPMFHENNSQVTVSHSQHQSKQMEHYLNASKNLSEGFALFEFALDATKWTINEARTFYKMMIKELGSPFQVLLKLLPHMASSIDARMLISDALNHDFQHIQNLKLLLGPLYRIYIGIIDGFYSLQLSEHNDREALLALIELNTAMINKRRDVFKKGDTSQFDQEWTCFRNFVLDNSPIHSNINEWLENIPEKGRLEFDFVTIDKDPVAYKSQKEISNLRLFRLLLALGLIDESKRRRMFTKLTANAEDARVASRGLGTKKVEIGPNSAKAIAEYMEILYDGVTFKRASRQFSVDVTKEELHIIDDKKHSMKKKIISIPKDLNTSEKPAPVAAGPTMKPPLLSSSANHDLLGDQPTQQPPPQQQPPVPRGKLVSTKNTVPFNKDNNNTANETTTNSGNATAKPSDNNQGEAPGFNELISANVYGHHIKDMIHEYNSNSGVGNIDPSFIAMRVLDALETILSGRYLTCIQLAFVLEKFPFGNILINDYSTYRVELIISLFSRINDIVNFEYVLKELESYEIAILFFRIGYLNLWNPLKAEGHIYLNLSRYEERKIAKMLIILNYMEKGETWIDPYYRENPTLRPDSHKGKRDDDNADNHEEHEEHNLQETTSNEPQTENNNKTEGEERRVSTSLPPSASASRPQTAADGTVLDTTKSKKAEEKDSKEHDGPPAKVEEAREKWDLPPTWYAEDTLPTKGILSLQYFSGKGKQINGCEPNVPMRMAFTTLVLPLPYEDDIRASKMELTAENLEMILHENGITLSFTSSSSALTQPPVATDVVKGSPR